MILPTGNPALDAYLRNGYAAVRGMSSAFAASICGHMIRRQGEHGIRGHLAEIGTFEGRFFIALGLGLAPGEHAIGVDVYTWPSERVLDNLHANCARHGLARDRYSAIKGSTATMTTEHGCARIPIGCASRSSTARTSSRQRSMCSAAGRACTSTRRTCSKPSPPMSSPWGRMWKGTSRLS